MADKDSLEVNGYSFASLKDKEAAEEDAKKADYFKEKTRGRNGRALLAVYNAIVEQNIFKTPVGWEYLKKMQMQLDKDGVLEEQIPPIPVNIDLSRSAGREPVISLSGKAEENTEKEKRKAGLQISVCINILLVILVIVMFVITLKSDNPNILNYKRAIVDEYAAWDQELTERENKVRIKEQELLMEDYETDERGE